MNWPTCNNCKGERVHLTTDNRESSCSCCGSKKYNNEWGWHVWCDDCCLWTELYDTPQEAIDAFNDGKVK